MPSAKNDTQTRANAVLDRLNKTLDSLRKDDLGYPPMDGSPPADGAMPMAAAGAAPAGTPGGLQSLKDAQTKLGEVIQLMSTGASASDVADDVDMVETLLEGFMLEVDAETANVATAAKGMMAVMKMLYAKKDSVTSTPKAPQVAISARTITAPDEAGTSMYGKTPSLADKPNVPTQVVNPQEPVGAVYANEGAPATGQPAQAKKAFDTIAKAGDDDQDFKFPRDLNGARRARRQELYKRLDATQHGTPAYRQAKAAIATELGE